ncbi:hypothetical protein B0H11DRAFT_1996476, partial [Mycena galericulata]
MCLLLNTRNPALPFAPRRLMYFKAHTLRANLHCGVFGRTVHEPMTDCIALMVRLVRSRRQHPPRRR